MERAADRVLIFDTTLRDGEQSPGISLNSSEKLEIAQQLARLGGLGWRARYIDYLYVSFTNASAFSPTDTLPLTPFAKLLMGVQSTASLVTIGMIIARAVNVLH